MNHQNLRRLCVAVDLRGYSRLDASAQDAAQTDLERLLNEATAQAGLDRLAWNRQDQGDGELALVPPDQGEHLVVDDFVRALDGLLDRHNRDRLPQARLRLRMAVHFGVATLSAKGYAGPAPVVVSRLLASDELHQALESNPDADLVVALSDGVYNDMVLTRFTTLRPEAFTRHSVKTDKFEGQAWIRVVRREGADTGTDTGASAGSGDEAPAAARTEKGAADTRADTGADTTVHAENVVVNQFHEPAQIGVAGFQITRERP